jgi:hypothetical protein
MEECDNTSSPNYESPSENDYSNVDPNYSLSVDSYWDSFDRNSFSLHEVNVCVLNETRNVEFTIGKENRKSNSRKRKRTFQSEWNINETNLLRNTGHTYRNFKGGTEVPEWKLRPLLGSHLDWNIFLISPSSKHLIFQMISVFGRYHSQTKLHNPFNEVTYIKIQTPAVREGVTVTAVVHFVWETWLEQWGVQWIV